MSYPEQTQQPTSIKPAGLLIRAALTTAVVGLVCGLLGAAVAGNTGNVNAGILVRGLLTLVAVLLICRSLGARAKSAAIERPVLMVVTGAVGGFLLDPLTWVGRTALTQLATDPGVATVAGDLLLWSAVAGLGAFWGAQTTVGPARPLTPYG